MNTFNLNLKVIDTKNGKGIATKVNLPSQFPIYEIKGNLLKPEEINKSNEDVSLQIGAKLYLGPSGDYDDHINHSCNPNSYIHAVGGRAFLYSLYNIVAGTEITFDYSLTSTQTREEWSMNCNCQNFNCRKIISGFQYLDDVTKAKYKKLNIIPSYQNV